VGITCKLCTTLISHWTITCFIHSCTNKKKDQVQIEELSEFKNLVKFFQEGGIFELVCYLEVESTY
jgi:hypothetical protein